MHGHADADLQGLYDQLQREEEDLCSRRGLVPGADQQTFQLLVPNTFRLHYDDLLAPMQRVSGTPGRGDGGGVDVQRPRRKSIGRATSPSSDWDCLCAS